MCLQTFDKYTCAENLLIMLGNIRNTNIRNTEEAV